MGTMKDLSFAEVLDRAKLLLGDSIDYVQPGRTFWFMDVLCPPDHKISNGLLNVYLADPWHYPGSKAHSDCKHCLLIQATIDASSVTALMPLKHTSHHTDSAGVQALDVLLHLHESDRPCFTNDFCHVLGYKPTGSEHPGFIRLFYDKWPNLSL